DTRTRPSVDRRQLVHVDGEIDDAGIGRRTRLPEIDRHIRSEEQFARGDVRYRDREGPPRACSASARARPRAAGKRGVRASACRIASTGGGGRSRKYTWVNVRPHADRGGHITA